jgi:hypothetical protein
MSSAYATARASPIAIVVTGVDACSDEPLNIAQTLGRAARRLRVVDAGGELDLLALDRNSLRTRRLDVLRLGQHASYSFHVIPKP